MQFKRTKGMFSILGCLAYLAIPAHGEAWECNWVQPCDQTSQTCGGGCPICDPPIPDTCWCEADWDDDDNWTPPFSCGDYPDQSTEGTLIEHSNTGYCSNNGSLCSQNSDCKIGVECKNEEFLELQLVTETIGGTKIRVKNTTATDDELEIRFESKDTGAKTLTVAVLTLDATNGPITLKISDSAGIVTDTTD